MTVTDTGVPIPRNADEFAEQLADPKNGLLKDVQTIAAHADRYAKAQMAEGSETRRHLDAEIQMGIQKFLADAKDKDGSIVDVKRLNLDPTNGPATQTGNRYNRRAPGVALDKEFQDELDFVATLWHENPDPKARERMAHLRNAYSSVIPGDGGFLVPETLRAQLLQVALESAVVRPRATVVPMDSARVPFPAIDTTTNAGSVFGGMTAYWGEEGGTLTDSSGKFNRVTLDAKKLTGYSLVPNELLQDSLISFETLINTLWPKTLNFFEDQAFITGSGVGEPLGWLGDRNPASVAVSKETGQAAATIVYENVVKMYARMLPSSLNNAVWIVSPDVIPQLFTMALSVGTGGSAILVANAAGTGPQTLFGRPIVISEKPSVVGTRGDIAFVDLSYYLIGDRMQMSASSSTDFRFSTDQTAFRLIQRLDGRPWIQSAITPANSGSSLSPFVELETRS